MSLPPDPLRGPASPAPPQSERLGLPRELLEAIEAGQTAALSHWITQLLFSSVIEGALDAALFLAPLVPPQALARAIETAAAQARWALIPPLAASLPSGGAPLKLILDADWRGQTAALRALLERADPAADLYPALHNAALCGNLDAARLLLPRCDPSARDSSALLAAVAIGSADMVDLLLPRSNPSARRHQALAEAVGDIEILSRLIPLCQDPAGFNRAMSRAVRAGELQSARELAPFWRPELDDFFATRLVCRVANPPMLAVLLRQRPPPEDITLQLARQARQAAQSPAFFGPSSERHQLCAELLESLLEAQRIASAIPAPPLQTPRPRL